MWRAPGGEADLKPGDILGAYEIEALLGRGGMGVVFRARRQPDGETVALKVLREELSGDEIYKQRFGHELRAATEVQHKHLVRIFEGGVVGDRYFLAVQYVGGGSLEDRITTLGVLSLDDTLRITRELASGLDALHRTGIIHRDVKPSNIMLDEQGAAMLGDFGLAKGRAYTLLTKPGQLLGTLDYLAPELIRGLPAGRPSDIYALGCVVFECLSGAPPFGGKSLLQLGLAHLEEEPSDPCAGREDASPSISWAVRQALVKQPERRPQTATAYSHMLYLAATGSKG